MASGNSVVANIIGAGTGQGALANGDSGVEIAGSNDAVQGNLIAFNDLYGVAIDSGSQNMIQFNSIDANALLGIFLASGANGSISAPTLTGVVTSGGSSTITGTFTGAANTTYEVDFYASSTGAAGQGQIYIGSETVTTDANGDATITFQTSSPLPSGEFVTATATDPLGDTSEFSNSIPT
jgi:hypothetical protein